MAEDGSSKGGRVAIIVAAVGALATIVVAAINIVPQLSKSNEPSPLPTSSAQSTASAPSGAPASGGGGVVCTPALGEKVTITNVQSQSGGPAIGGSLAVSMHVNTPIAAGGQYWLMVSLPDDPRPIEIARKELSPGPDVTARVTISSGVGSVRTFYVAESISSTNTWFQANRDHDGDNLWDGNRISLPAGALKASNSCKVTRME